MDDAALLHLPKQIGSLVFTMDVITPIVDDPVSFGRIAAANSLSDVYAMGGTPQVALSFAGIPGKLGLNVFTDVLRGMAEKAQEAQCAIVGGHTIKDSEPKCGLVVIGHVDPETVWTHTKAQVGHQLVLTKPVGTGILAQARRGDYISDDALQDAVVMMETLNAHAAQVGKQYGATSATDVTGFGLLGHLHHMAKGSGLAARLWTHNVPVFNHAYDAAQAGYIPGGTKRNAAYVDAYLMGHSTLDPARFMLMADAQTSGGLLLSLPQESIPEVLQALPGSALVGEWLEGPAGTIELL